MHLQLNTAANEPPLVRGRRIKLRYAHPAGTCPPRIAISGTQVERLPAPYQRYLANGFRETFGLVGVPLGLEFKDVHNPYADKSAGRRAPANTRQPHRTRSRRK